MHTLLPSRARTKTVKRGLAGSAPVAPAAGPCSAGGMAPAHLPPHSSPGVARDEHKALPIPEEREVSLVLVLYIDLSLVRLLCRYIRLELQAGM